MQRDIESSNCDLTTFDGVDGGSDAICQMGTTSWDS
jgi:hypothetical protein